jgi:hypothetical protein
MGGAIRIAQQGGKSDLARFPERDAADRSRSNPQPPKEST